MSRPAAIPRVADASAWRAADFVTPRSWVRSLEAEHLTEIDSALEGARADGRDETSVDAESFPLAATIALLDECRERLETGPGFAVLTGFPVDRYGPSDVRLAFAGLMSHLGRIATQTCRGDKLIDVVDRDRPYDHTSRGYHSRRRLPFHTDGAHSVGLLCLETSREGGESVLVSAATAHNLVAAERPDLWQVLARGFHHHRRGEEGPGEPPVSPRPIPVFAFRNGVLHAMYNRNPIEWSEREGYALDARQREALDYLDAVLARPELQLEMGLERGDIQIVDNFVVFHSRNEYVDEPPRRRHLLRIWLERPDSRRAGPTLLDLYARR